MTFYNYILELSYNVCKFLNLIVEFRRKDFNHENICNLHYMSNFHERTRSIVSY